MITAKNEFLTLALKVVIFALIVPKVIVVLITQLTSTVKSSLKRTSKYVFKLVLESIIINLRMSFLKVKIQFLMFYRFKTVAKEKKNHIRISSSSEQLARQQQTIPRAGSHNNLLISRYSHIDKLGLFYQVTTTISQYTQSVVEQIHVSFSDFDFKRKDDQSESDIEFIYGDDSHSSSWEIHS